MLIKQMGGDESIKITQVRSEPSGRGSTRESSSVDHRMAAPPFPLAGLWWGGGVADSRHQST